LIATDNTRLAKALVRQGRHAEALPHAQRALEIYEQHAFASDIEAARKLLADCQADDD
jgi:hypothetical protein